MSYQYKFTIFTPCYNSASFIHRVYDSLISQTYKNFEWLVINDGSTDNTSNIIKEYITKAPFDVQFFDLEENQMLTKNYNLAVKKAKGEFFVPAGHDDEFLPGTLEVFLIYWDKYGNDKFSGISCLCKDQNGNLVGDRFPASPFFSNYFDVVYNKKIKGEKWGITRTEVMREYFLPENIDIYVSEVLIWMSIGAAYSTIYINEVLRIYYIHALGNSLTSINKKRNKYPAGSAYYYLQMINHYHQHIKGNMYLKIKSFLNYFALSLCAGNRISKILNQVRCLRERILLIILSPIGYTVYLRQKLRNKK